MRLYRPQKPLPEIYILYFAALSPLPVITDPVLNPVLIECIHQISGVRIDLHLTGMIQCLKARDASKQLHAVIGCPSVAL